jgi:hypothetical protein
MILVILTATLSIFMIVFKKNRDIKKNNINWIDHDEFDEIPNE